MGTMMKKFRLAALATAGVLAFGAANAFAADIAKPQDEGWTFTVAPYLWASGIKGESGLFGFPPQDVDVSFSDVLGGFAITLRSAQRDLTVEGVERVSS